MSRIINAIFQLLLNFLSRSTQLKTCRAAEATRHMILFSLLAKIRGSARSIIPAALRLEGGIVL